MKESSPLFHCRYYFECRVSTFIRRQWRFAVAWKFSRCWTNTLYKWCTGKMGCHAAGRRATCGTRVWYWSAPLTMKHRFLRKCTHHLHTAKSSTRRRPINMVLTMATGGMIHAVLGEKLKIKETNAFTSGRPVVWGGRQLGSVINSMCTWRPGLGVW